MNIKKEPGTSTLFGIDKPEIFIESNGYLDIKNEPMFDEIVEEQSIEAHVGTNNSPPLIHDYYTDSSHLHKLKTPKFEVFKVKDEPGDENSYMEDVIIANEPVVDENPTFLTSEGENYNIYYDPLQTAAIQSEAELEFENDQSNLLEPTPFFCEYCKLEFPSILDYQKHNNEVHLKYNKVYVCEYDFCKMKCRSKETYNRHIERSHRRYYSNLQIDCSYCDEAFSSNALLRNHIINKHEDARSHSCHLCTRRFFHKWHLQQHLAYHEKPGVDQINYQKMQSTISELPAVMNVVKIEAQQKHTTVSEPYPIKLSEVKIETQDLQSTSSNDQNVIVKQRAKKNRPKPRKTYDMQSEYLCKICYGIRINNKADAKEHFDRFHSEDQLITMCKVCCTIMPKNRLTTHLRTHVSEKPLQCKYCGERFTEPNDLFNHAKLHV